MNLDRNKSAEQRLLVLTPTGATPGSLLNCSNVAASTQSLAIAVSDSAGSSAQASER